MGNSIGGRKKKTAKIMKLDGTAFRVKPPATAAEVLYDHPGFQILESEEVKLLGARARPLEPSASLKAGRLYFLVELPRAPPARRAWSGALNVGARERLESLMLTRRSTSDLSVAKSCASPNLDELSKNDENKNGVRVRMRLPRAQVEKLMQESRDSAEAAEKIMELCGMTPDRSPVIDTRRTPEMSPAINRRRTPEMSPLNMRTPEMSPLSMRTPEMSPLSMRTPERGAGILRTPERWPSMVRTPELRSPDVKTGRNEKRTRFVALPDEIIA